MEEKKKKKSLKIVLIVVIAVILVLAAIAGTIYLTGRDKTDEDESNTSKMQEDDEDDDIDIIPEDQVSSNELSEFDLEFLKIENEEENKIYSPLSIKYALKMLEEGASGKTKKQIEKVIGEYDFKDYITSKEISFANGLFVRDSFKDEIKESYVDALKEKYDADVKYDSFESSTNINDWIKTKTLDIISQIVADSDLKNLNFALINALAIDLDWEDKFIHREEGTGYASYRSTEYLHEKKASDSDYYEFIDVYDVTQVDEEKFNGVDGELDVAGMHIEATINNYDIINELGEENIKNTVSEEYTKFAKGKEYDTEHAGGDFPLSEDTSDEGIKEALDDFLPTYISELKSNYHKIGKTTDFSIYTDDDVKVFAKDLKKSNGTTLQYIAIMPTDEELDKFIDEVDVDTISEYISNLKTLDNDNFKDGVVTRITGYIPKFKFEYNLDLMGDLKELGIVDVFDSEKADLSNMIENTSSYISTALHKANIEFTEDGIKAAAVTLMGGLGAGSPFDYYFDVPVEEIDMTFDNPYMFLIRDKETGETWFAGTVYEPLSWEDEPSNNYNY